MQDIGELLRRTGNLRANEIYEKEVRNMMKPGPKEPRSTKVAWIRAKYGELLGRAVVPPPASLFDLSDSRGDRERRRDSRDGEGKEITVKGDRRARDKDEKEERDRERRRERDRIAIKAGYLGRQKTNPATWVKNWFVLAGIHLNWHKTREVSVDLFWRSHWQSRSCAHPRSRTESQG